LRLGSEDKSLGIVVSLRQRSNPARGTPVFLERIVENMKIITNNTSEMAEICAALAREGINFKAIKAFGVWEIEVYKD